MRRAELLILHGRRRRGICRAGMLEVTIWSGRLKVLLLLLLGSWLLRSGEGGIRLVVLHGCLRAGQVHRVGG